jgi:hypothetical protein
VAWLRVWFFECFYDSFKRKNTVKRTVKGFCVQIAQKQYLQFGVFVTFAVFKKSSKK